MKNKSKRQDKNRLILHDKTGMKRKYRFSELGKEIKLRKMLNKVEFYLIF